MWSKGMDDSVSLEYPTRKLSLEMGSTGTGATLGTRSHLSHCLWGSGRGKFRVLPPYK